MMNKEQCEAALAYIHADRGHLLHGTTHHAACDCQFKTACESLKAAMELPRLVKQYNASMAVRANGDTAIYERIVELADELLSHWRGGEEGKKDE